MTGLSRTAPGAALPAMTDDRKNDHRTNDPVKKKNPTFGISVFIVVVVLFVIGTLLFNAIREKREFERMNAAPSSASDVRPAVPAIGASQ